MLSSIFWNDTCYFYFEPEAFYLTLIWPSRHPLLNQLSFLLLRQLHFFTPFIVPFMQTTYYTLPLRLDKVLKGESHEKCLLKDSLTQHIHLIITTSFGEMQHDESFGCSIWDTDFDNLTANNKIRENIKQSIQQAVTQYEERLEHVKVEIYIKEEELLSKINGRHVKKRLDIQLTGVIRLTSEKYFYQDHFYTGPLSYY